MRPDRHANHEVNNHGPLMMALMMVCCLGFLLLVLLIPLIGWGPGLAVIGIGAAVMYFLHWRFMGHGTHS